ncbi:MAG TPA: D-alanine--poly(phosphoribitol) ligase subunit DltC [Roseiflexaceae bacterium]|nr:D-alanine--poly(phosphoribitol) ligase subunit DltC [Roseiflexaceae bacterium]
MSISERVLTILESVAERDDLRQDIDIQLYDEHILDSLKTVELMIALSEAFNIEIAPASFERAQWSTPRLISAYVEQAVRA